MKRLKKLKEGEFNFHSNVESRIRSINPEIEKLAALLPYGDE